MCTDLDRLLVQRSHLYVYDLRRRRIVAVWKDPGRIRAIRLLPGSKQALVNGGETGWRLVDIP